ncbi:MAG: TonB-dependent receptor [Candidatus Sedimenticola sp. (ex Thyasira tokunagai)]
MKKRSIETNGLLTLIFIFAIYSCNLSAEEYAAGSFLNEDLEDWLEMEVFSTTKTFMPIKKSPGVVRVFTRQDFKRFGFKTLKDLMTVVPGIQLVRSYKNHTNMWVRGIQTRYNSKLLLLIDGVPIRENYYGHFNIDKGMVLDNVERVEIISGPGSVLYGANAFAGVISVTTKTAGQSMSFEVAAQEGYGYHSNAPELINEKPHDRHTYSGMVSIEADADLNENNRLYAFAQLGSGNPFNPERDHEQGQPYQHDLKEEKRYFMGKLIIDNLTLTVSDNETNIPDVYGKHFKDYQHIHRPKYISLAYNGLADSTGNLNGLIWYENYNYDETKKEYEDSGSGVIEELKESFIYSLMYGMDLDYTTTFAQSHQLTAGVSWLHDESIGRIKEHVNDGSGWGEWEYSMSNNISRDTVGLFLQENWEINNTLSLISGVRYDFLSDFDDQLSYRIGLTGLSESGNYGKLLLGSAYRTPNYREYTKVGMENYSIKSEELITTELQVGKIFADGDVNLTVFYNLYNEFINDILVPEDGSSCANTDQYYTNFDNRELFGLEFNSTYFPTKKLSLKVSATSILRATEENGDIPADVIAKGGSCDSAGYESGEQDIKLLSKHILSVLASYRFNERYQGGINLQYASARKTPDNYHENIIPELKQSSTDNPDAYYLLDLFAKIDFDKNMNLDLRINNLLDGKIYHPRLSDVGDYDVELPGRHYELRFNYEF